MAVARLLAMRPFYQIQSNGTLELNLHPGQSAAWRSERRFVGVLAGTQGGKTSFGPWWEWREIRRRGAGDYLAVTASFDLFKLKMLPEMREVFEHTLRVGRYWASERVIELQDPETGKFLANRSDDPMWGRIILRSAAAGGGLESATAKGAWLDEAGQDEFDVSAWEAVLRRLALHQGRALLTTTIYNLGWLKAEVYDRWADGDPDFDVVQFASTMNPMFPRAEYERAKRTMPAWRFSMFYDGKFTKPLGLIYADFEDWMVVDPFIPPAEWPRVVGTDFGGANTAQVWLAQQPTTGIWFAYAETLTGDMTTEEHAARAQRMSEGIAQVEAWGGAPSETQYRMDWAAAGFPIRQPSVADVEAGIDRVTGLMKTGKFRLCRDCVGLRDEIGKYRRKLDDLGEPTELILNKSMFHRLDALRYAAVGATAGVVDYAPSIWQ